MKKIVVLICFLLWGTLAFGAPATITDIVQRFQAVSKKKTVVSLMEQMLTFGVQRLGIARDQADQAMARLDAFNYDSQAARLLAEKSAGRLSAEDLDYLAKWGDVTVLNRLWAADEAGEAPDFAQKLKQYQPEALDDAKKQALDELVAFKVSTSKRYTPSFLKLIDSLLRPLVPSASVPMLDKFRSVAANTVDTGGGYAEYLFQHDQYLYRELAASDIEALDALHRDKVCVKFWGVVNDVAEAIVDQMADAAILKSDPNSN